MKSLLRTRASLAALLAQWVPAICGKSPSPNLPASTTAGAVSIDLRTPTARSTRRDVSGDNEIAQIEGQMSMIDAAEKRGQIIKHLQEALALAAEIEDGNTGYLIERALDWVRSEQFRLA